MIHTGVFDYINVLNMAADASWLRNNAIASNIANGDTPGYKRQDVAFEAELAKALGAGTDTSHMDQRVARAVRRGVHGRLYTDMSGLSYRLDGNNVDPETEQVALAENATKYQGLMTSITAEFKNLQMVLK